MSLWEKVFGKASKNANPTPANAIQRLREVEDMLLKKQVFLEKKQHEELEIIKKNGTKNKRISLQALKRKKRLDKQLQQIDGTLTTVEYQREALENANSNAEVLKCMNSAAKALKGVHNNMDIDKVEDLMDEVREQQQIAEEISSVISNPIGFGNEVDEDDLMKELEELEQEELDKQLIETGQPEKLPEVPKSSSGNTVAEKKKEKPKETEEDELNELAAWAN